MHFSPVQGGQMSEDGEGKYLYDYSKKQDDGGQGGGWGVSTISTDLGAQEASVKDQLFYL